MPRFFRQGVVKLIVFIICNRLAGTVNKQLDYGENVAEDTRVLNRSPI